jgi:hypothetical protein
MERNPPEKPLERYAGEIVVHCRTGKQALFMPGQIKTGMNGCKLELHPGKTQTVNLRVIIQQRYPKGFDFPGFTIKPASFRTRGKKIIALPDIFVSQKSKTGIMQKFREMNMHKWRTSLEHIAKAINSAVRGIINCYRKFQRNDISPVWRQLNIRLLKRVNREKDTGKKKAIRYLKAKYKEKPTLFEHWSLVHP